MWTFVAGGYTIVDANQQPRDSGFDLILSQKLIVVKGSELFEALWCWDKCWQGEPLHSL